MIGIKAAVGHRRAYDKIASASFTVSTRGPCTSDLARLPYQKTAAARFSPRCRDEVTCKTPAVIVPAGEDRRN